MENARNKYINRGIKNFQLNSQSRELLVFLFFVFFATAVWFIMTLSDDYETEITVPVQMVNVPKGMVLTTDIPQTMQVVVKDKGSRILWDYKLHKIQVVKFDFHDYEGKGERVYISQSDLQKRIALELLQTTRVISVKPDSISYSYAHGVARRVPVKLLPGSVKMAPQYYLSQVNFTPRYVTVYAAESLMDTLSAVYVAPEITDDLKDTVSMELTPISIPGAKIYSKKVHTRFCAVQFTEKTVEVPIVSVNFPADMVLRTFPSKVNVTFQVAISDFDRINADNFVISISYEELLNIGNEKLKLRVKSVPKGAHRVRIYPSSVDYLIEHR